MHRCCLLLCILFSLNHLLQWMLLSCSSGKLLGKAAEALQFLPVQQEPLFLHCLCQQFHITAALVLTQLFGTPGVDF